MRRIRRFDRVRLSLANALALTFTLTASPLAAQSCDASCISAGACVDPAIGRVSSRSFAIGAGAITLSALLLDTELRDAVAAHRGRGLDRVAHDVDPFGRAGVLLPAIAASVVAPRAFGMRRLSEQTTRVAVDYLVSDAVESLLKPIVGRHRPSDGGGAWRFAPFRNDADWHSFPSAHTVHAFSLATGIARESGSRWAAVPAYGLASMVGLERIYTNAHWSSDVASSAALAILLSGATNDWTRTHGIGGLLRPAPSCRPPS